MTGDIEEPGTVVSIHSPAIREEIDAHWLPIPDGLTNHGPSDKLVYATLCEYQEAPANRLLDVLGVSDGGIYGSLHRLRDLGLVESRACDSEDAKTFWRPSHVDVTLPEIPADPTWGDSDV